MTIHTEYLIDERGHKKSVVLSLRDYLKLVEYLEDLEDAVDLKKAKDSAKSTIINAIIGIVIVVIAWSLTVILGQFLGISPNILGNITIGTP